ncbi:hypothetical protein HGP28_13305 [Vibrio sp. SM6]|uniref:Uncharacterized protein n=1 Tax=Vibrio agarilyticus TaxID=2726741 RepID=A0A7X8TS81_9VIBR|nr:hypothetical protein [Vibrio agarilyticus]NLS13866.1 hypothetical protein [Vibrio agarilyticus]
MGEPNASMDEKSIAHTTIATKYDFSVINGAGGRHSGIDTITEFVGRFCHINPNWAAAAQSLGD